MTRIALLSDVHGNIHALQAVWADLERQTPDAVYCLGDVVGYGGFPNEVIDFLTAHGVPTLMGNYDEGVGFDLADCGCVYRDPYQDALGRQSLAWSRRHTRPANKAWLKELPFQFRLQEGRRQLLLVHGSPRKINEYLYQDRPRATFERLAKLTGCDVIFYGHTHLPYQKKVAGTWFVNTGSVGKPKDGDPRAGYTLAEFGRTMRFDHRRVAYDVEAAAAGVAEAGLPPEFAQQLRMGGEARAASHAFIHNAE